MASTAEGAPVGSFGIDDLGRVQFDRLCVALLTAGSGLPASAFEPGMPGERIVVVRAGVRLPFSDRELPGRTVVMPLWKGGGDDPDRTLSVMHALEPELRCVPEPASFLVLTNGRGRFRDTFRGRELVVLGPDELGAALVRGRDVCFDLPWLAGLREASGILDAGAVARSSGDVAGALELAAVFVETAAYARALAAVRRHGFTVLSGPPEMGKTAIARMLGLAGLSAGYELHECTRPDDLFARLDPQRAQIFVADDAFGSTEYRPDAAERWALDLDRALRAMDERHWLVWTARPGPLHAALARINREHGVERFPRPAEIHVDASALTTTEKALILFRHARAARLERSTREALRLTGPRIVANPLITPERIRRLVRRGLSGLLARGGDSLVEVVEREIREPTTAMTTSYEALDPALRTVLVALVDAPDGAVAERIVAQGARRHGDGSLPRPIGELLDHLTDHFVHRVEDNAVTWVHPSLRDVVIETLAADAKARPRFLRAASIEGLLLALSVAGGAEGRRQRPLLVADADYDAAADRIVELTRELADEDARRLLQALTTTLAAPSTAAAHAELAALAALALDRTRSRLDANLDGDLELLDAWFELAASSDDQRPIAVDALWAALVPSPDTDLTDPVDARRADDWSRLVATLARHARGTLRRLHASHARGVRLLTAEVRRLGRLAEPPETIDLVVNAVRRLGAAASPLGQATLELVAARYLAETPEPLDEPDVARPRHPRFDDLPDRRIVGLILADL